MYRNSFGSYYIMEVGCQPFTLNQEDNQNSPENRDESPPSPLFHDTKATSTSSPKKRRGTQKRVVHVPIKGVEGSRLKGEMNAPPSDSWAWRKYGQKPIKGSPYPRWVVSQLYILIHQIIAALPRIQHRAMNQNHRFDDYSVNADVSKSEHCGASSFHSPVASAAIYGA